MDLKVTDVAVISKTTQIKVSLELEVDGEMKVLSCVVTEVTMEDPDSDTVWHELKSVKPEGFFPMVHKYRERIFCALSA